MKFSKFVHQFDLEDGVCLYHSLLLKKVYMSKDEWNLIKPHFNKDLNELSGELNRLFDLGFIVSEGEDARLRELAIQKLNEPKKIHTMFLVLTEDCNFRCRCCYESDLKKDSHLSMNFDTAKRAINTFAKVTRHEIPRTILFYGGEPLLEKQLVIDCLDYITELEKENRLRRPTYKSITTNGTLLTEDLIKSLKKYGNLSIGLSFDGFEHNQNANRVYAGNKGTYKDVVSAIRLLNKYKMEFSAICTVGTHNVYELEDIVKHFVEDLGIKSVAFNLLISKGDGKNPLEVSGELAAKNIIKAYDYLNSKGCYEGRLSRQMIPFIEEKLYFFDCDASGSQVVVTPDGLVGPCVGFISSRRGFQNKIDNFDIYNGENELYLKASPIVMEECQNCASIGICGGGCHYNRIMKEGDAYKPEKEFCNYANGVLKWMIEKSKPQKN